MMRNLLMTALLLIGTVSLNAQTAQQKDMSTIKQKAFQNYATQVQTPISGNEVGTSNLATKPATPYPALGYPKSTAATVIGQTTYDLQSNGGIGRRMAISEDGQTIVAAWTQSFSEDIAAPDRGTGLNISTDGGDTWREIPSERIEGDTRVGWPSIGILSSGRIFSMTHTGDAGANFAYSDDNGDTWNNTPVGSLIGDTDGVWARLGYDGEAIHAVISRQTAFNDMDGGLAYFRSLDGGDTWEGPEALPNIADYVFSVTADAYYVDVNGDNVAITIAQYGESVLLYQSDDAGDSWDVTVISDSGLAGAEVVAGMTMDEVILGASDISVLLDDDGTTHVAYDAVYNFQDPDGDAGPFYLPVVSFIMYWNSNMDEPMVIGETVRQDYDGDGEVDPNVPTEIEVQSYGVGLVSHPSLSIDDSGNVYLGFSSTRDGAYETVNGTVNDLRQYRDVYLVSTSDDGANWDGPLNVSNDDTMEDAYPFIAPKVVDGTVHMIWQRDQYTGTAVQPDQGHENYVTNEIMYESIPVASIAINAEDIDTDPTLVVASTPTVFLEDCPVENSVNADRWDRLIVFDFPDGIIDNDNVTIGGDLDVSTPGLYTVTLEVTDSDGNTYVEDFEGFGDIVAGEPWAEVVGCDDELVTPTEEFPFILFLEPVLAFDNDGDGVADSYAEDANLDTIDVVLGSDYTPSGAFVLNDNGAAFGCSAEVVSTNPVDTDVAGTYVVEYTATDHCGYEAIPTQQVVNVIGADTQAPEIILIDNNGEAFACNDTLDFDLIAGVQYTDPGFYAFDNVDLDITDQVEVEGEVMDGTPGVYTLTFSVTDAAGNTTECIRYVSLADNLAPVITVTGPPVLAYPCGQEFNYLDTNPPTAIDNVDGNISDMVSIEGVVNWTCPDSYTLDYFVYDAAGNLGTASQTFIITEGQCNQNNVDCDPNAVWSGISDTPALPSQSLLVSPVPTNNVLNINFNADRYDLRIFDATGRMVQHSTLFGQSNISLDVSNYTPGIYFISATTDLGTVTKKAIINR